MVESTLFHGKSVSETGKNCTLIPELKVITYVGEIMLPLVWKIVFLKTIPFHN